MIGLDTNVMVRYLVQDDPDQSAAAATAIDALTENDPGFVTLVTVVELYWVLRRAYNISTARCAELLEGLLMPGNSGSTKSAVRAALTISRDGFDFADGLIAGLGRAAGCDHTVTFDQRAAKSNQMRLLVTG